MSFSANIIKYRKKNGFSQKHLAEKLNVGQSAIAMWETGQRMPNTATLYKIAKILSCDVTSLIQKADGAVLNFYSSFEASKAVKIPLFTSRVSAGFPSPADDYIEKKLDLHELLIKNESSTFFVRVEGDSMLDARIESGDILVVDKATAPKDGSIVIAVLDGDLTVKRVRKSGKKLYLVPENADYKPIEITKETDFVVWGVVTNVIHPV